ncbi:MAG: hypothetical protein J1F35_00865 [Erysipelotrichales bacterium]|nr:hypothetical protein [Erysipelotrichales bacterium]
MNKIKKIGKVTIHDEEIVKKTDKNNEDTFTYLESRDFHNYLMFSERTNDTSIYPFIKDLSLDDYQKSEDLIDNVALLHNKTSYNKEVNQEKHKKIRDNIIGYINHLDSYYYSMLDAIELIEFPSPSDTIFLRNYSKLLELFDFLKNETNSWYELTSNKTKERVCLNHGDIRLDHLIKGDKEYLISWDKSTFDSPILDIINFYHEEWEKLDFETLLKRYLDKCSLTEEEKKLLFINIAIPEKLKKTNDELINVSNTRRLFDYIYKTEKLIRPYYSVEKKE